MKLQGCLNAEGQILIDSAGPRVEQFKQGYPGEARIELSYRGQWGEAYGELYCDLQTLEEVARLSGWNSQAFFVEGDGTFVARLFR